MSRRRKRSSIIWIFLIPIWISWIIIKIILKIISDVTTENKYKTPENSDCWFITIKHIKYGIIPYPIKNIKNYLSDYCVGWEVGPNSGLEHCHIYLKFSNEVNLMYIEQLFENYKYRYYDPY
ncbi:MAG TPA: hypothetical protein O0X14_01065, partial [Methanocorpusculum sp.]|nr:hypothetical protein [Methanocorpusculum sp.]